MAAPSPPIVISKSAINPLPLHGRRLRYHRRSQSTVRRTSHGGVQHVLAVVSTLAKPFAVWKDQLIDTVTHASCEAHGISPGEHCINMLMQLQPTRIMNTQYICILFSRLLQNFDAVIPLINHIFTAYILKVNEPSHPAYILYL